MRIERSLGSFLVLFALGAEACGGSAPAPSTPPESTPASAATSTAAADSSAKPDDESWAGENAAKSGDTKSAEAKPAAAPASDTPAPPADTKAPETRTMDVIRKVVMDNRKAARKCYDDALKDQKDLKGDVTIHFVLDPEGKVKSAELNQERSTLKAPVVVNCVLDVIKGIQFPKSSRAMETSTNYPFNFTH